MATGFWMAKEIGAFEKNGIHAELIYISSGPVVIQALIGGDLQGRRAATDAVINAILNGAPSLGVAGTSNRPYHRLYVQPEINRLEDLRGKTLGVTRFGAITDNLTRILLRKNNLENAVTLRQLGPPRRWERHSSSGLSPAPSLPTFVWEPSSRRRFSSISWI